MRTALDHLGARLNADHTDGDPALRQAIARWLSSSRGLLVEQDQIILSAGRQHALHIVAHMLLRPGVQVAIEQPCDPRSERLITSTGATVIRVPVDHAGVQTDLLPETPVAMILVTPEHQRPLGAVMSQQRRQALLAWTERSGATVVADDIDGESAIRSHGCTPLIGTRLPLGRVIHLGGFALSLGPGVHLGYLAVPRQMIAAARAAGRLMDDHSGQLEAAALAELLDSGGYARHLHQLRKSYLGRRDRHDGGVAPTVRGGHRHRRRQRGAASGLASRSGLGRASTVAVLARRHGLDAAPLGDATILLGFGVPDEHHIETSVGGLAHALAAANQRRPPIPAISLGFSRTAARGALR